MDTGLTYLFLNADYFVLLLMRTSALIFASPIFGRINIPQIAKIGLVFGLTYLFFLSHPNSEIFAYTSAFGFFLLIASELLIGVALAFVTNIFFTLTFVAGQMIDMQIGFGIVSVYDIQNNTQVPVFGNVLNITLLLVFFIVNGHHRLIEVLYMTLEMLPVGGLVFRPEIGLVALELFALAFTLGVMVALPVVASGLVLEIAFGTLMRSVPQLNMFVVGIPMKTLVGFLMIIAILPIFSNFSEVIFSNMFLGIRQMFDTFLVV